MDGVTSPLISKLVDTLVSFIEKEAETIGTAKVQLDRLKEKLVRIKSIVNDAEALPFWKQKEIKRWIMELKGVVYDAEDVIEEYKVKMEISTNAASSFNKVGKAFTGPLASFKQHVAYPHKLGHNIKDINQKLSRFTDDLETHEKIKLLLSSAHNIGHTAEPGITAVDDRATTSVLVEGEEVGREDDKRELINQLQQGGVKKNRNYSIVAIVGKGGLGKTYLAKMIFNDQKEIKNQFTDNVWWVCVAEHPKTTDLVKKLLQTIVGKDASDGATELEPLCNKLRERIKDKKFLLVLDDVWDLAWWEELEAHLQNSAPGSKVLITTRNDNLLRSFMCDVSKLNLKEFTWEESWKLFKNQIGESEVVFNDDQEMKEIGERIVKKCGGLPLVIKIVGRLLHTKNDKEQWKYVEDSPMWEWKSGHDKGILPGLMLSYLDLPPNLKNCFVYCSLFPKDFQMEKEMLTEQWVAQGFVEDKNGVDIQQTAKRYLDELVSRCLLEDKLEDLKPGHLCMHDIIHDLALSIGGEEYCVGSVKQYTRHLSLIGKDVPDSLQQDGLKLGGKKLRTLLCREVLSPGLPPKVVANMKGLRVLRLERCDREDFRDCIDELLHLRYLDLNSSYIKQMSASIRLRTLNISDCPNIELLPCLLTLEVMRLEGLRRWKGWSTLDGQATAVLTHLKKLRIRSCPKIKLLPCIPAVESMELEGLESWEGWSTVDDPAALTLQHLKRLLIRNCPKIKLLPCIPAVELVALYHLKSWEGWSRGGHETAILQRLKRLWIWNCPKIKLLPQLPKVESVVLYQLESWEGWLTRGDEAATLMSRLKRLEISECPVVKVLPHLPEVEELRLEKLANWERWSSLKDEATTFRRLKRWKIVECPKVINVLPHFPADVGLEGSSSWEGCWYLTKLRSWEGWPDEQTLKLVEVGGRARLLGMPPHFVSLDIRFFTESRISETNEIGCTLDELNGYGQKHFVLDLIFSCASMSTDDAVNLVGKKHGEVLEAVPPTRKLEKLTLEGYKGEKLPHWLFVKENIGGRLKELNVNGCPKIKVLPCCPALEHMELDKLEGLEEWGGGDDGGAPTLPHLNYLKMHGCPKIKVLPYCPAVEHMELDKLEGLEGWWAGDDGGLPTLPHLNYLEMRACPKIKVLPRLPKIKRVKLYELERLEGYWWAGNDGKAAKLLRLHMSVRLNVNLLSGLVIVEELELTGDKELKSTGDDVVRIACPKQLEIQNCTLFSIFPPDTVSMDIRFFTGHSDIWSECTPDDLQGKKHLKVDLKFCCESMSGDDEVGKKHLDALECLRPPRSLERLTLQGYKGEQLPSWFFVEANIWGRSLKELALHDGGAATLPRLKHLEMRDCPMIKMLPCLPAIEHLELDKLEGLEEWWGGDDGGAPTLSRLNYLEMRACPKIKVLPRLPAVERMELWELESLEGWWGGDDGGASTLPCLNYLKMRACPNIMVLPRLLAVERMELWELESLEGWWGGDDGGAPTLPRLIYLEMCACPKIKVLPRLPTVECMKLGAMESLEGWWEGDDGGSPTFPSLKHLHMSYCPIIKVLPCLLAIEHMELWGLESLEGWCTTPFLCNANGQRAVGGSFILSHRPHPLAVQAREKGNFPILPPNQGLRQESLEGWWGGDDGEVPTLPRLNYLEMRACPKIKVLPRLPEIKQMKLYELKRLEGNLWAGDDGKAATPLCLHMSVHLNVNLSPGLLAIKELVLTGDDEARIPCPKQLEIQNCPLFAIFPSDTVSANIRFFTAHYHRWFEGLRDDLKGKKHLVVDLIFCCESMYEDDHVGKKHEDVLECLRPPHSLERLTLEGYDGEQLPSWFFLETNIGGSLMEVALNDGEAPTLSRLNYLDMKDCPRIKVLPCLPAVKRMELWKLGSLEGWWGGDDGEAPTLPHLNYLKMRACPKIKVLPRLPKIEQMKLYELDILEGYWWAGDDGKAETPLRLHMSVRLNVNVLPGLVAIEKLELTGDDGARIPCPKQLEIQNCPHFSSFPPDIVSVDIRFITRGIEIDRSFRYNLRGAKHLVVDLIFCCESMCGDEEVGKTHKDVLECLRPPHSLERLRLQGYMGEQLPSWFFMKTNVWGSLKEVAHHDGGAPTLLRLNYLHMCDCPRIQVLPCLPAVERMELQELESLEGWWGRDDGGAPTLPHLNYLEMRACPKIEVLPKLPEIKQMKLRELERLEGYWWAGDDGKAETLLCLHMSARLDVNLLSGLLLVDELEVTGSCSMLIDRVEARIACPKRLEIKNCPHFSSFPPDIVSLDIRFVTGSDHRQFQRIPDDLQGKKHLVVDLIFGCESIWGDYMVGKKHEDALECLRPPHSLERLTLQGYKGKQLPRWFFMKTNVGGSLKEVAGDGEGARNFIRVSKKFNRGRT